jgi:iron complex outermembrane recepter protein
MIAVLSYLQASVLALGATAVDANDSNTNDAEASNQAADVQQVQAAPEQATAPENQIVVTGVRGSLSSAQAIKREEQQIVDAVVAEDIGKFPDNNVVEALQRVPGVQVSPRARGESSTVLIRGLPDVVTLINGRNIFSTTARSLSLADVPADLVAGVNVYKSRAADQIEGGIAGQIDVRTRRPFDFDGLEFAVAAREVYSDQPDEIDPYASLLLSDRWETSIGDMGALVSASYHRTHYRDETIFGGGFFGYNLDNSRAPYTPGVPLDPRGSAPSEPRVFRTDVIGAFDRIGIRTRPAVNIALQWAPSSSLSFFMDGLYYGYYDKGNGNQNFTSMNGALLAPITFVGDTKLVKNISVANARVANFGQAYENDADRWQTAIGGTWEQDAWSVLSEVSYTKSQATDIGTALDVDFLASRIDGDFNYEGRGTPRFQVPNENIADPALYNLSRLSTTRTEGDSDEIVWRGDLSYNDPLGIFTTLSVGTRINERQANSDAFNQAVNCSATGAVRCFTVRANSIPGLMSVTPGDFYDGVRSFARQWATPGTGFLLDNRGLLRRQFGLAETDPAFQDTLHFDISESSYAAYAQASFEVGKLDGEAGVRVVKTDITSNAFRALRGSTEPVTIKNDSIDTLPSLALRYKLRDDLFLRASASRTITRPSFAQLNPALTLTPPIPGQQPFGKGSSGNAELQPIESTNYDLALEWYIDSSNSITATVFHRDVTGFIQSVTSNFEIDYLGADNGVYQITRPENSGSGKLTGVEGGFTFFPSFLPAALDGLGLNANGTYIDGENEALAPLPGVTGYITIPFQNVSKRSATATLIYEKHGLSARASYVWRDSYNAGLHFTGVNPNGITNGPIENLDLSISYEFNRNFTLVFDATNILQDLYQTSFTDPSLYPRDTVLYTRTFALGFRAKL